VGAGRKTLGLGRQIDSQDSSRRRQPVRRSDRDPGLLTLRPPRVTVGDGGREHSFILPAGSVPTDCRRRARWRCRYGCQRPQQPQDSPCRSGKHARSSGSVLARMLTDSFVRPVMRLCRSTIERAPSQTPSKEVQLTSLPHFTANTGRRQCRLPDRTDYITWLLQIGFKAHIHFIREHVGIVQTIPSCSSKAIYHRCNKRKRGTHHVVKEWPISYSTMKHQVPMSVQSSKGLANFRALLS